MHTLTSAWFSLLNPSLVACPPHWQEPASERKMSEGIKKTSLPHAVHGWMAAK